ncbi:MAG: LD-carboxypeptidase [Pseudomonadota bacterium]
MINRRTAIQSALAAALAAAAPASAHNHTERRALRKPKRLRNGQTVGIIAPASNVSEFESIEMAADIVRSLGFEVKKGANLYERSNYLAGDDRGRADDVNAMFADDSVDAIFCLRGGYGTSRMLPYLDFETIGKNPKIILGYSDITALLNAIHKNTGLVTFHGPIALQNFTDYTLGEYRKVLVEPSPRTVIGQAPPFDGRPGLIDKTNRLTRIVGGKARGPLIGGNLSLLAAIHGTPYEPDYEGAILFLEDVDEAPYRVDRMLTQLWLAGALEKVAGVAIGKFTDTDGYDGNEFSMEDVIRMRFEPLGVPTIRGLMIGHVDDQTTVPLGVQAELDVDAGTLTLLEAAVS